MSSYIIVYIPVIHRGYLNFLEKYASADKLFLLDEDLIAEFSQLRKDIRALKPAQVQKALQSLGLHSSIQLLNESEITELSAAKDFEVVMPDEDIMHQLAAKYLSGVVVTFDTVFLRWDSQNALKHLEVRADEIIEGGEFHQEMIAQARELAEKSGDWWRQVGALIVKDGQVISETFNQHVPTQQQPYFDGDPRGSFHKGVNIEISTALHAEASLIAQAAQVGCSLQGASLYVTTFPCPNCAKLVAYSGIETVYFAEGYAMVDGERILKDRGVRMVKVSSQS